MLLEKWYGDAVTDGHVQIFYRANLMLGPVAVGYYGRISNDGRTASRISAGGIAPAREENGVLVWPDVESGKDVVWSNAGSRPIELWREADRAISWDPIVLRGRVSSDDAQGYAERLRMNFAPWRLGLRLLKWGRFCGRDHSLAWIEWQGAHSLRLALLDAKRVELIEATRGDVRVDAATVRFADPRILLSEPIGTGALRGWRLPIGLGALEFFRGIETKWLAKAELEIPGVPPDAGYAVFEEVAWA